MKAQAAPPASPRALRIAGAVLAGIAVCEAIPLVFAIGHLDRLLFRPQSLGAFAGALAIAGAYVGYSAQSPGIRRRIGTVGWITIPAVAVAITAGIVEEIYFRQVLMNALRDAGVAAVVQVIVSGVTFGLFHAIWGIGSGWRVMRGAVVATTMLGTAFAALFVLDGRVVLPCVEAHVLVDLVLEPALVLYAVESALQRRTPARR